MWSEPQICRGKLSISEKGKVWVSECFLSGLTPPLFNFLQVEDRRGWAASESDPRFCQRVDSANVCTILPIPVYPVSLLSTPPPHPSALAPNPPTTQPKPSLQNGPAPGSFQNGELLLPAQPISIPSANGASINGRGQPRCLHPLPAASPVRRASFCGEGHSPPLQQWFLHVCLHVPPAGRCTRLPQQGLPSFPPTPPSSVCPTKYGLLPHKHAQPQRRWGLPALRFSSGGPWWSGRWIPVCLHPSQAAKGLPGGRLLTAPALLRRRRERIWLWRCSYPLQVA